MYYKEGFLCIRITGQAEKKTMTSEKTDTIKKLVNNVSRYETIAWSDLKAYEFNGLKKSAGRDVGKLKNAIINRGFNFPFFIWADHRFVIDGAGRRAALLELEAQGWEIPSLPVVMIEAASLKEAKALVLQASSEHGEVTVDSFSEFSVDLDLDDLLGDISFPGLDFEQEDAQGLEAAGDPDDAPEAPEQPFTQLGDIYEIGPHRLLCGDSTISENVQKVLSGHQPNLMVTDPPYGVEYDANWRNEADRANGKSLGARAIGGVLNDSRADWRDAWALFPGNIAYVWHADRHASIVHESLESCNFRIRNQIIWAKNNFAISRVDYHWQHEPCWYAVREKGDWTGDRSQSTLWNIDKPLKSETGHSTQKPVECMARPMRNHGKPGDYIYEPFGGSGTTMVAAHQEDRRCLMTELNPHYCDVIVARMKSLFPQLEIRHNGNAL